MQPSSHVKRPDGFTLVELLVVVLIMSLMLTFAANMLSGNDKLKGLQSGVDLMTSTLTEAKDIAKARSTWVRVVIPHIPEDNTIYSRNLRYAAIVAWTPENPMDLEMRPMSNDNEWKVVGRGIEFPSGIYFDPELSKTLRDPDIKDSGRPMNTKTVLAKLSKGAPVECYYIEFDRLGRLTWPRGATKVVLVAATIRPDGKMVYNPQEGSRPAQVSGIVVMPNGEISTLRNKEQVFSN